MTMTRTLYAACLAAATMAILPTSGLARQWATPPAATPLAQQYSFQSAVVEKTVTYHVMLPAGYDQQPERRYPVIFWLHGSGSAIAGIPPTSQWFNTSMAQGKLPPSIVVFPNGMTFGMWTDSKDGSVPMETVVIEELLPEVDARFRTIPNRQGRIVEGFSMGGYGAARLGFQHHGLFGGVSILGGGPLQLDFLTAPLGSTISMELRLEIYEAVWGSDPDYFLAQSPWVRAQQNAPTLIALGQRIRQAVGQLDFTAPDNLVFAEHLSQLGLPSAFYYPAGISHQATPLLQHLSSVDPDFYRQQFEPLGPGAAAVDLLPGCSGTPVQLSTAGGVAKIGSSLTVTLQSPLHATGLAQLYIGQPGTGPTGCGLLLPGFGELLLALDPQPLLLTAVPLSSGAAAFSLALANQPASIGLEVAMQGVVIGSGATGLEIGLSQALFFRVGQ